MSDPKIDVPACELQFPASAAQQRLWFMEQYLGQTCIYNVPTAILLRGALDLAALRESFVQLIARHEVLRTTFSMIDGVVMQIVAPVGIPAFSAIDMDAQQAQEMATARARLPFDLATGPLMRVDLYRTDTERYLLLINLHHIITDAWSVGVMLDELAALYGARIAGRVSPLAALPLQYADYSEWQREWLATEAQPHLTYWQAQLKDLAPPTFPRARPPGQLAAAISTKTHATLPAPLTQALKELAKASGCTFYMVLLTGLAALLNRYTGQDDIAIGIPVAGRDQVEIEPLLGFFVNMLVARVDSAGASAFSQLLTRVKRVVLDGFEHQSVPFERAVESLGNRRRFQETPLFDVVFDLHPSALPDWTFADLQASALELDSGSAEFGLVLTCVEDADGLLMRLEYDRERVGDVLGQKLLSHYAALLAAVASKPSQDVWTLPLLTAPERTSLLEASRAPRTAPAGSTIAQLFEAQAALRPDAVALIEEGREWRYGELNRAANRIAHQLIALGVGPDVPVGIALDRSATLVAGLLGILKAGGAYVPLDPHYPAERLRFLIGDTGVHAVVGDATAQERFPQCSTVDATAAWQGEDDVANPDVAILPGHLAYILYTSGSTGLPKGVAVSQEAVVQLVCGANYVTLGPQEVLLQYAPLSFDASTFELWGALLHGARLVIAPPGPAALEELGALIRRHSVSTLWLTTGLFHQMIQSVLDDLRSVRQLLTGGDAIDVGCMQRAVDSLDRCRLIHCYGVTEATTFTTTHTVAMQEQGQGVAVGVPISGSAVYLLSEHGELVPAGVEGEICIGGIGLARGYTSQPGLTAQCFVPDHVSGASGARLYRTGDWGRWNSEGHLEFIGRRDQQIKLRGFRIELGELETQLLRHEQVQACTALVLGQGASKQLVAYLVGGAGPLPEPAQLRTFLQQHLPEHMLPASYVWLERLPLTANGKIDRAALPTPPAHVPTDRLAPRSPLESTLAALWAGELGLDEVGVDEDFFDLGGHSLLATKLITRIREELDVQFTLREFFDASSVTALAAQVQTRQEVQRTVLADQVAAMSPEEKQRLLHLFRQQNAGDQS